MPIEAIFNRGAYPLDGGSDLVNATSWQRSEPAIVTWYPSMRMIVDMGDYDASQAVLLTGQSRHPYSPHHDDQIPLWLNGELHPIVWSQTAVETGSVDTLVLKPGE